MRACYVKLLAVIESFLASSFTAIEYVVNSHIQRELVAFFNKITKDNIVKNGLPKYAAGTDFAKTLKALATLSIVATDTCTMGMTAAAHATQHPAKTNSTDHTSITNAGHFTAPETAPNGAAVNARPATHDAPTPAAAKNAPAIGAEIAAATSTAICPNSGVADAISSYLCDALHSAPDHAPPAAWHS